MKILVIADDLTGANDTGALLADIGLKVASTVQTDEYSDKFAGYDVLSIDAASRGLTRDQAYQKIADIAANTLPYNAVMYSKRIDSTLRGNVGAEIDAMLDTLMPPHKALVVPAFPRAKRTCTGGCVRVDGLPLELTDLANDPVCPVTCSDILTVIGMQSRKEAALIPLDTVRKGVPALAEAIVRVREPILVFDAATDDDVQRIAKAGVLAGISFICVDPGALTRYVAMEKFIKERESRISQRALLVIGSCMEPTLQQIEYVRTSRNAFVCEIDALQLVDAFDAQCEQALRAVKAAAQTRQLLCITTAFSPRVEDAVKIPLISRNLCSLAQRILDQPSLGITVCYVSGGDVAKDFLTQSRAAGVDIIREVLPLAVFGRVIGGKYNGLRLLSKGGMIGDHQSIATMLESTGF